MKNEHEIIFFFPRNKFRIFFVDVYLFSHAYSE